MTIDDEFAGFMHATHDEPAFLPEVQFTETRRAFFAGAWAVLCALEGEEIAYERSLLAAEMAEECRQFKQDVLAGKA